METQLTENEVWVAPYLRVSTEAQDGEDKVSLDEQLEAIQGYCDERGYRVFEVYRDIGHGWSRHRPEFIRMVEDGKSGRYQRIICWRLDRLGRGVIPLVPVFELVDYYGIEVEGVNQFISKDMLAFLAVQGKMELDGIRERTAMGRRGVAKSGRVPIRNVPYGYRLDKDRRPQIDEAQAEIVRKIYRLSGEDGLGHLRIAGRLNEVRDPTPAESERGWSDGTVSTILSNEVYHAGIWYYGRNQVFLSQENGKVKRNLRLRPESEWIPIDFPKIISADDWQSARRLIDSRMRFSRRNTKVHYMLQGLVICEECGLLMNCRSNSPLPRQDGIPREERKVRRYYLCGGMNKRTATCRPTARIPAELLEDVIWDDFRRIVSHPSIMVTGVQSLSDVLKDHHRSLAEAIRNAETRRTGCLERREYLMDGLIADAVEDGEDPKAVSAKFDALLATYDGRLMEIDEEINSLRLNQEATQHQMNGGVIQDLADNIDELLSALSDEDRVSLLKSVCKSITIDGSNQVTIITFLPLDESAELDLPSAA